MFSDFYLVLFFNILLANWIIFQQTQALDSYL